MSHPSITPSCNPLLSQERLIMTYTSYIFQRIFSSYCHYQDNSATYQDDFQQLLSLEQLLALLVGITIQQALRTMVGFIFHVTSGSWHVFASLHKGPVAFHSSISAEGLAHFKVKQVKAAGLLRGGERGLRMAPYQLRLDRTCRSETAIPGALLCGGIQCFDPSLTLTKRIAQGTATASGGQTLRGNCPLALRAALHAAPRRTRLSYVEHIG